MIVKPLGLIGSENSVLPGTAGINVAVGVLLAVMAGNAPAWADNDPAIAAAADLNHALPEIAAMFSKRTGKRVRISYGSSGNFARQIAQGAPFGMFLSADEEYVKKLSRLGLTQGDGKLYALGRIVLFAPRGSALDISGGPDSFSRILGRGDIGRFAIANPEHAPYGRAAREALVHIGVWDNISSRLVLGENASQATQFTISGSTEGGLIPYSQALAPPVSKRGTYVMVPEGWHSPLRQRMVLLKKPSDTVQQFYDFMQTPEARAVLNRFGFAPPGASD